MPGGVASDAANLIITIMQLSSQLGESAALHELELPA